MIQAVLYTLDRTTNYTAAGTFFEEVGEGDQVIVLCHGVGLDHTMWDRQVTALAPYFRVVRYDMFGHGRTAARPNVTAIGDFVVQLKELLDFLEISKLTLVGLSMGGVIAQGFAADAHERLEKLILMNTVYRRTDAELKGVRSRLKITVDKGLEPVADLALDRWFDDAFRRANPDVVTRIRNRLISNDLVAYSTAYQIFVEADREIGAALKQVRCPTLVMTGELDTGSTPELAYRMAADLCDAQVVILPGLRHLAPLEDPPQVNRVLLEFLGTDLLPS